jgi:integrase
MWSVIIKESNGAVAPRPGGPKRASGYLPILSFNNFYILFPSFSFAGTATYTARGLAVLVDSVALGFSSCETMARLTNTSPGEASMKGNLIKSEIAKLGTDRNSGERFYDTRVAGLGINVFPLVRTDGTQDPQGGKKSWFVDYSLPSGKRRRFKLGDARPGGMTTEQARTRARDVQRDARLGVDPLDVRKGQEAPWTLGAWIDCYMEANGQTVVRDGGEVTYQYSGNHRLSRGTLQDDRRLLNRLISVAGASTPLENVTAEHVAAWYQAEESRGTQWARRGLQRVRAMLNAAILKKHLSTNVARRVRWGRENPPRTRTYSEAEMTQLLDALKLVRPDVADAIRVLILTGARKSEVCQMKWGDLDLDRAVWTMKTSKTGQAITRPLDPEVVQILVRRPRESESEYCFPGETAGHLGNLSTTWEKLRKSAGLENAWIHDLRRTFGLKITKSSGLQFASRLLGHANISTTARIYSPLAIDDLRVALTGFPGGPATERKEK